MSDKQDRVPAFSNLVELRDRFAGQALAGMCANPEESYHSYDELAKRAYLQADAMIAERGKQ